MEKSNTEAAVDFNFYSSVCGDVLKFTGEVDVIILVTNGEINIISISMDLPTIVTGIALFELLLNQ